MRYNRLHQHKQYWFREGVLNYLDLFFDGDTMPHFNTEQDLLEDVYDFIKSSKRLSRTTAEKFKYCAHFIC
jgi:hypothetical protein